MRNRERHRDREHYTRIYESLRRIAKSLGATDVELYAYAADARKYFSPSAVSHDLATLAVQVQARLHSEESKKREDVGELLEEINRLHRELIAREVEICYREAEIDKLTDKLIDANCLRPRAKNK